MFLQAGGVASNDGARFNFSQPIYLTQIYCRSTGNFDADYYIGVRNIQTGQTPSFPIDDVDLLTGASTWGINSNGSGAGASTLSPGWYRFSIPIRCQWLTLLRISATMQIEIYFTLKK